MTRKLLSLFIFFITTQSTHASIYAFFSPAPSFSDKVRALAHEIEQLKAEKYVPTILVAELYSKGIPEYLRVTQEELDQWRENIKSSFDFGEYCITCGLVQEKMNSVSALYAESTQLLYSGSHLEEDFLVHRWYLDRCHIALQIMFSEMSDLARELQKIKK